MSTKGTTFEKAKMSEWLAPDAPERWEKGRRCVRGEECVQFAYGARWGDYQPAKVRSTATEHGLHPQTGQPVVLCDKCEQVRIQSALSVRKFLGLTEFGRTRGKNMRGSCVPLPNLLGLREGYGVSRKTLATSLGMWATTVARIEAGGNASEETAKRFAEYFGTTVEYLRAEQ